MSNDESDIDNDAAYWDGYWDGFYADRDATSDQAKKVTNLVEFVSVHFEFQSTYFEFQSTYCKINISCFPTMNIVNIISFIILTGNGDTGIRPL